MYPYPRQSKALPVSKGPVALSGFDTPNQSLLT